MCLDGLERLLAIVVGIEEEIGQPQRAAVWGGGGGREEGGRGGEGLWASGGIRSRGRGALLTLALLTMAPMTTTLPRKVAACAWLGLGMGLGMGLGLGLGLG